MRRLARLLVWALLLIAAAIVSGTLIPRPFGAMRSDAIQIPTQRILLLSNPIHTDLALPVDAEVLRRFGFLAQDGLPIGDAAARYLVVGWGGRAFYLETPTWSELKFGPAAKALTVDDAVMHVEIGGDIDAGHPEVMPLDIDAARYDALLDAIEASFTRGADGSAEIIAGKSYGTYDRFYEAKGRFNALLGCNTWTAAMLRAGGLRTGLWTPLPKLLVWSLGLHNRMPAR